MRITVDERPVGAFSVWPSVEQCCAELVGADFEVALSPTETSPCRVLDVERVSPRVLRIGVEVLECRLIEAGR